MDLWLIFVQNTNFQQLFNLEHAHCPSMMEGHLDAL